MERLALLSAFFVAGTGPIPIIAGSTPATAIEIIFARGFNPYFFNVISLANNIAAAPSLMPDELPAVTVPSFVNAGFKEANFSRLVLRGCSSTSINLSSILTPTISSFHLPASNAAKYFSCEANANSSWATLVICHCFATFSAVSPML